MRAAVYPGGGKPLEVMTLPDPKPGRGEVVIRVGRCGICGTDLHMTSGHRWDMKAGSVIGHEYGGEIVELGAEVADLKIGDRITAMPLAGCGNCDACRGGFPVLCPEKVSYCGGLGQFMRVRATSAVGLPESLSLADGALIEPLAVSLHGVSLARMEAGARVLVLGAGSVGMAAIFWARQLGAGRIVAYSRSTAHAELAGTMGADGFVAAGSDEIPAVERLLGGPPDFVFEAAGVVGMLSKALRFVRPDGTIISLGSCIEPDPFIPGIAVMKQVRFIFSLGSAIDEFIHAARTLDRGHVEPRAMITDVVGLDELPALFQAMHTSRGGRAKVQVDPWL